MNRKYIIWVIPGIILIGILSVVTGINMGKNHRVPTPTPAYTQVPEVREANLSTTAPETEKIYTIRLQENILVLYENEQKLNETEIAPHVLPSSDITALKNGLEYSSLENALMDWESLCK